MTTTVVTPHARKRFRERFRLQFHREAFEPQRVKFIISDLFDKSSPCDFALKQCAGLYNKLCVQHGCKVHYNVYNNIMFVYTYTDGLRYILTIMRSDSWVCGRQIGVKYVV